MQDLNKLLQAIEKTGYPIELRVGSIFTKDGWNVQYNRYYVDKDEVKAREIDINAFKNTHSENENLVVGLHILCEVKNSPKPWIVFSTQKGILDGGGWLRLHYILGMERGIVPFHVLEAKSSISKFSRIGRSYCEGFKLDAEKSEIFKALTSVVKASEDCLEKNEKAAKEHKDKQQRLLCFLDHLIVLNGLLYEAYLDENDELYIHEIDHALVSFGYISVEYQRYRYLVDLVTLKELPNLLSAKRKWLESIKDAVVKNLRSK